MTHVDFEISSGGLSVSSTRSRMRHTSGSSSISLQMLSALATASPLSGATSRTSFAGAIADGLRVR
jgi:hypothetical protein